VPRALAQVLPSDRGSDRNQSGECRCVLCVGVGIRWRARRGGARLSATGRGPGGEKPSYARRLEDALNDVMGSRATKHYVSRDFEKNVHAWLTRESGQIRIMHNSENGFLVELETPRGRATGRDEDLEVAIVFAEDELATQVHDAEFEPPALPPHLSENAPRARGRSRERPTYEHPRSAGRIIEREEARTRREERPFD